LLFMAEAKLFRKRYVSFLRNVIRTSYIPLIQSHGTGLKRLMQVF
jgi:hypothetical protein